MHYLNSYYRDISKSRNEIYMDFVGHIHRSTFDLINGICNVPSFNRDRFNNGAWHLKLYFDEQGHIYNIVLIPLYKKEELIPITEIAYKKVLTK